MKGVGLTYTVFCAVLMAALIDATAIQERSVEAQSVDATIPLNIKFLLGGGKGGLLGSSSGGATYIRWGRTTCPDVDRTKLVYAGRAAGSMWNQRGGSTDYICLPDQPQYLNYQAGVQNFSPLQGAEYQYPLRKNLHDHNVPCAVCQSTARGSLIMIPARISCPNTWTLEYSGYLVSDKGNHFRTSTECMDKDAEAIAGSGKNTDGALFYHMEATCNGIKCPPYVPEKELTCAVCTK